MGTDREETQRGLMVAIAKKLLSWGSLTKINSFVDILQRNVKTNLSGTDMTFFYFASQAVAFKDGHRHEHRHLLPGAGDVTYKGNKWCWKYEQGGVPGDYQHHAQPLYHRRDPGYDPVWCRRTELGGLSEGRRFRPAGALYGGDFTDTPRVRGQMPHPRRIGAGGDGKNAAKACISWAFAWYTSYDSKW